MPRVAGAARQQMRACVLLQVDSNNSSRAAMFAAAALLPVPIDASRVAAPGRGRSRRLSCGAAHGAVRVFTPNAAQCAAPAFPDAGPSLAFGRENAIALQARRTGLLGETSKPMIPFRLSRHRALAPAIASAMRRQRAHGVRRGGGSVGSAAMRNASGPAESLDSAGSRLFGPTCELSHSTTRGMN